MRAGLLLLFLSIGCGTRSERPAEQSCPPGLVRLADTCAPRRDDCGPLAVPTSTGDCLPVGIPAGGCGEGFANDGEAACRAILPPAPCPKGQLAIPGETSCHAVSPCGDAPFPAVDEATARFVDKGAAPGGDGTRARPFDTIGGAIASARAGDTIAITDGVYAEDLAITRPLTVVGRCPERVVIRGQSAPFAIRVVAAATLRGVAVEGPTTGIGVAAATDVVLDHLWLHDNLEGAVYAVDDSGTTSFTLSDSLVEDNLGFGVRTFGCAASVERALVRRTVSSGKLSGAGLVVLDNDKPDRHRGALSVRRSVIADNQAAAILALGAKVSVEATWLGGTVAAPKSPDYAVAISIARDGARDAPASVDAELAIDRTVIENSLGSGIVAVGARVDATRLTVRDLRPTRNPFGLFGGDGAVLNVQSSVLRRVSGGALVAHGATVHVEGSLVDDVRRSSSPTPFDGIGCELSWNGQDVPGSTLKSTVISGARAFGAYAFGVDLTLEDVALRKVALAEAGGFGDGINVMTMLDAAGDHRGVLTARGVWISEVGRAALVVFGADARIEHLRSECNPLDVVIVDRAVDADGAMGELPIALDDGGGNVCGCGARFRACSAQREAITPVAAPPRTPP